MVVRAGRFLLAAASVLLALVCECGPNQAASVFKYPIDDIVVNVDFLPLIGLVSQFQGSSYAFKYVDHGEVCSSPYVSVDVKSTKITWNTDVDVLSGKYDTTISPAIVMHIEVSQCTGIGTFKTDIQCNTTIQFNYLGGDLSIPTTCRLDNGNIFDILFSKTFVTQIPALLPSHVPVQLTDPPPVGGLTVDFQFTQFQNGNWVPLPPPLNRQRDWPMDVTAMFGGFSAIQVPNPPTPTTYSLLGSNLNLSGTITHQRFWGTTGIGLLAAIQTTLASFQYKLDPLLFIRVRQTLIAPPTVTSPQDPRYGLLGGLFPMKITAVYEPSNSISLGVEVDISSVTFKIHAQGATPTFEASINVDRVNVIDRNTGSALASSVQNPSITLVGPTVDSQNNVRFDVNSLDLTVQTQLRAANFAIKLGDLLKQVINDNLPNIAALTPSITVAVPQCFPANNTRVQSQIACTDEYGGQTIGYAARTTPAKSTTIAIDLRKTIISAKEGELEIDFFK
jgi:hypothetical protein